MKRTQVQLDEATYQVLRDKAAERQISLSALIREIVQAQLAGTPEPRRAEDFRFIGAGRSQPSTLDPMSERHDEALSEDFAA